jgi:Mechanosensitive ion channel, beta-domain
MLDTLRELTSNPIAHTLAIVLSGLVVVYIVVRVVRRALGRSIEDVDTRYRARKFVTLFGYLLGATVVAVAFSDRLGNIAVALGVAGAGIAFALQGVVASIAGWAAISAGGFYSPGDRVQIGKIRGDVIDVSILRTTLMEIGEWVNGDLYSGRVVRVANSFVFKEPVFNYSGGFPFLWDEIVVPIRYGSDWVRARTMLRALVDDVLSGYAAQVKDSWVQLARRYRLEEANVDPMVTLRATDNWIEFTVRYVVDYRKRRWMKDHLFTRILEEIDRSDNQIRLASATFEVVPGSTVDVHLSRAQRPANSGA